MRLESEDPISIPAPGRSSCVSQTGEAELAAREIAPQICGHLRLPGRGTLALAGVVSMVPGPSVEDVR